MVVRSSFDTRRVMIDFVAHDYWVELDAAEALKLADLLQEAAAKAGAGGASAPEHRRGGASA